MQNAHTGATEKCDDKTLTEQRYVMIEAIFTNRKILATNYRFLQREFLSILLNHFI